MKKILNKRVASTMSEVFTSIVAVVLIIGVAFPFLASSISERKWAEQKKNFYVNIAKTVPLYDDLSSYTDAKDFTYSVIDKAIKVNNFCEKDALLECGFDFTTDKLKILDDSLTTFPNSWEMLGTDVDFGDETRNNSMVAGFDTINNEAVMVFYNPTCVKRKSFKPIQILGVNEGLDMFDYVCANLVYDLNKAKGPNKIGKDIGFITLFYSKNSAVVSPVPAKNPTTITKSNLCEEGFRIPNRLEAASLALNFKFLAKNPEGPYLTSEKGASGLNTYTYMQGKNEDNEIKSYTEEGNVYTGFTRCVKK